MGVRYVSRTYNVKFLYSMNNFVRTELIGVKAFCYGKWPNDSGIKRILYFFCVCEAIHFNLWNFSMCI